MDEAILVINAGSSSLKFEMFACVPAGEPRTIADGQFEGLGARPHLIARAGELTSDRKALAALRAELRNRLQHSPLMDAPRYVADLEALLGAQLA